MKKTLLVMLALCLALLPAMGLTEGFDPKWYLTPFPLTEVNKGYGLVQNPGW